MIKQLTHSGLPAAADVIRRSFATVAKDLNLTEQNCPRHPTFNTTTERLREFYDAGAPMFGLFEDGRLVGYVALSRKDDGVYGLHNLAVLPEARHKGYGKHLLDHCKAYVNGLGGRKIAIEVIEDNVVLKEWYLANGFAHLSTHKIDALPFTFGCMEWECE